MAIYIAPKSDERRREQLTEAAAQAQRDQTDGRAILSTQRTADLTALAQSFGQLMDARLTAEHIVEARREAFAAAIPMMKGELKHAWAGVRASIVSGAWSTAIAVYYPLPASGSPDYPNTPREWLQAGLKTLHGDTLAAAQGVGGLANRAKLQTACDTAVAALDALETADAALFAARQAVNAQRPACDDMLKLMISELRSSVRLQSPVEMRRLLRAYGGQFRYRQNEPAEGEEETVELPLAA